MSANVFFLLDIDNRYLPKNDDQNDKTSTARNYNKIWYTLLLVEIPSFHLSVGSKFTKMIC